MSRKIVAGNWKMNGDRASVAALLDQVAAIRAECEVVVFPSFIFISEAQQRLSSSKVAWGGQNMATATEGAFTGEVSGLMLKDFGCKYVLVGHSERRAIYGESDEMVAQKFILAQKMNLIPMLCVGESQQERESNQTKAVVSRQIDAVIAAAGISAFERSVIAYEPVWAIGTGLTATPQQAQEVHAQIREQIAQKDDRIAQHLSILYGGSVKPSNAAELFAMADIDGGLVGGASLDAKGFGEICAANK